MLVAQRAPLPVSRSWPAAEGVRPLRPRAERLTRWSQAEYCRSHRRADHAGKSTGVRHHAGCAQPAAPGARCLVLANNPGWVCPVRAGAGPSGSRGTDRVVLSGPLVGFSTTIVFGLVTATRITACIGVQWDSSAGMT